MIYRELTRAHENLVLDNELHLLYLATPLDLRDSVEPEWMTYFKQVSIFHAVMHVGHVSRFFLNRHQQTSTLQVVVSIGTSEPFEKNL